MMRKYLLLIALCLVAKIGCCQIYIRPDSIHIRLRMLNHDGSPVCGDTITITESEKDGLSLSRTEALSSEDNLYYRNIARTSFSISVSNKGYKTCSESFADSVKFIEGVVVMSKNKECSDSKIINSLDSANAAKSGAEYDLKQGKLYYYGIGTPVNKHNAFRNYDAAARKRSAEGQRLTGLMYLSGEGVARDSVQAFSLIERAAKNGDTEAKELLGSWYYLGTFEREPDYRTAIKLLRPLAEGGSSIQAAAYLGHAYREGNMVDEDLFKAEHYLEKAAEKDNENAQYWLGELYANKSDLVKAQKWFKRAIENQHPDAQKALEKVNNKLSGKQENPANERKTDRLAIVIGNADYEHSTLKNPVNDAFAVKKALESVGFQVKGMTNANSSEMSDIVESITETCKGYETVLFYYAGHAVQIDDINYLCPIDVDPTSSKKKDLDKKCCILDNIISDLNDTDAKNRIVIMDACRNNPIRTRGMDASGLSSFKSLPLGTFLSYATQKDSKANDMAEDDADHSPFTVALLEELQHPDVPIDIMFKHIRNSVIKRTGGQQIPFHANNLDESEKDFCLSHANRQKEDTNQ